MKTVRYRPDAIKNLKRIATLRPVFPGRSTQTALAAQVGITQPSLAQAETGRRGLSVHTCAKLAKVLQVRIEDLRDDA